MKVLVVGATGKTGHWVTTQLGAGADMAVRALVRDRAKADFAAGVEVEEAGGGVHR